MSLRKPSCVDTEWNLTRNCRKGGNMKFGIRRKHNLLGFVYPLIALAGTLSTAQVNATTWQYNNWRTGQNTSETTLTTTNVRENSFGKICSASVDGQIYAQPLVLWNSSTNKNVVYVVTQNDSIYAFDGTNCSLIASNTSLIPSTEAPNKTKRLAACAASRV